MTNWLLVYSIIIFVIAIIFILYVTSPRPWEPPKWPDVKDGEDLFLELSEKFKKIKPTDKPQA